MSFDHREIEKKWQKRWRESKLYKADNKKENKYYLLVELTYTSGDLHMGHWFAWTAPDAYARMKRMQGFNVLFPVGGFDAFGLPAENAAIKHGIHPREWTYKNIEIMRKQFERMGPSFDWEKEVITSDPDYYRWTQWLFIQLYKKGLAYRGKVWSNWCPECKTVLANEHVVNGCCWRHTSTPVEQKLVDQWLFKITEYADRLIWPLDSARGKPEKKEGLPLEAPKERSGVDWPQAAIEGQNNWIGRKEGINITYDVKDLQDKITVFTTAPVNFGATFIVLAPEHPVVEEIITGQIVVPEKILNELKNYIKKASSKTQRERKTTEKEKSGVFTGLYAINHVTKKEIPVWVTDFVLMDVGTGAVQGCPGHDLRDFQFAKKFGIPIVRVIVGEDGYEGPVEKEDQIIEHGMKGKFINSDFLNGLDFEVGLQKTMDYFEEKGWGKRVISYHLRDWSVSRRRYWGAPVPIIYCRKCWEIGDWRLEIGKKSEIKNLKVKTNHQSLITNHKLQEGIDFTTLDDGKEYIIHSVPEADLPVKLPEVVDYMPKGLAPLATAEDWVKVKCPVCGSEASREVETLDTYVDSSWYFFRYPTPKYDRGPFDKEIIKKWMPIQVYFGGSEHILGHTLYARFISQFLHDQGYIDFDEFALKRIHHGVILGPDGYRMSKSRGNVVNPDEQVEKFGADSVRLYINFLGPHDKGGAWKTEGIEGSYRFLMRVWRLITNNKDLVVVEKEDAEDILRMQHRTIKRVSEDIEMLHTHTAIAALMEFTNLLEEVRNKVLDSTNKSHRTLNTEHRTQIRCAEWDEALKTLCLLLAPFAPHMTEEIYQRYYAGNPKSEIRNPKQIPNSKFRNTKLKTSHQSPQYQSVRGKPITNHFSSVHLHPWPKYNPELIVEDTVTIAIQINGKLRGTIEVRSEKSEVRGEIIRLAKENEKINKWIEGKKVKKEVFVKGKLLNFVVN